MRIWLFIAVAAVIAIGFIFSRPISHVVDTPLMREYSRILEICTKLVYYADAHSTFTGGVTNITSVAGLVEIGAISADDAAYIQDHQIKYRGFDLNHMTANVIVFETIFTNTDSPRHICGFSDGHVTMQNPDKKP